MISFVYDRNASVGLYAGSSERVIVSRLNSVFASNVSSAGILSPRVYAIPIAS